MVLDSFKKNSQNKINSALRCRQDEQVTDHAVEEWAFTDIIDNDLAINCKQRMHK